MKKSIFLMCFLALSLNATTIKSITYKGLIHLSDLVANEISGLKVGDKLTGQSSHKAIVNLFKQGYFEDIVIEENDGNVVVKVKEKPSITRVDIKGVVTNDQKAISSLITIKPGQMYDDLSVKRAKESIRQFYEAKGYFDTVVDAQTKQVNENDNALHLILTVNRGENIIINKVNLVGANVLDYSDIEPAVANKEREFMGWLWGRNDGKMRIFDLAQDPNRIQDEYYKKGYLDAQISGPYLNAYMDNYTADLTYYVSEGKPYKVDKISIDIPNYLGINKDELLSSLKLQAGDRLNSAWIRRDMEKMENLIADKGYAFVKVVPQTQKDEENQLVSINYEINPSDKVYIRNVIISGNDRTIDKVIRRELYITEGNLYSRTDLTDSKNALRRTGYFEEVDIKENRVGKNEIDLEVVVQETTTGSITGGIGYETSGGLLLNAGISDTNIFGTGLKGAFNIDKSKDELSGNIKLTNPRIFDSEYSLGGSIFADNYKRGNYDERNIGFSTTLGRKIGRYTEIYLTYLLESSRIRGLDPYYQKAGYQNGKNIKSALIPGISFNNTDDFYLPRTGIITGLNLEYAGAGGDMKFLKSSVYLNAYQGLADYIDYDLILRYKSNFGYIWDWEKGPKNLPINEKLNLGGIRSIRGFQSRSVTPRQDVCINGICKMIETSGKIAFNNSFEVSIPLINRIKMRAFGFFDYGIIGESKINEVERYSTGAGIEWITPLGPLQFIYSHPLNNKPGDELSRFEFSIGRRF